jgi:hypothetical protein
MLGIRLSNGLPNLQSAIAGVKIHTLASPIWTSETQVMAKRKARSQNWQFDSRPLKVKNRPDFLAFKQRVTYHWKALDQGYNFALYFITIRSLHAKLCALKVARVLIVRISRLPLGNPGTKSHFNVTPVESCRVYYKGEGGGFPQVRAMVNLACSSCPWLVLAPKVFQLCTNHFVLVFCKSMWLIEACHFFLVPSRSSSTPLYPSIVLRARERASTHCSFVVFSLGLTFESFKELGMHHDQVHFCPKHESKLCSNPT